MQRLVKYPRTPHLEGSRLQPGDEDLSQVPLDDLRGQYVVVEEKLDGANAGMSVDAEGRLQLQSRGHVLVGGPRERHWNLFKRWAAAHAPRLAELVADRFIYGEWLYAKHTIFYDRLPHYWMEFDIFDGAEFWSTARRHELLAGSPIVSVPVLWQGVVTRPRTLPDLVRESLYKSPAWRERLRAAAEQAGVDPDRAARETDPLDTAEGLYLKVESATAVLARYKWIRASFLTTVVDSGSHWLDRTIIPNQLAPDVDIFT